VVQAVTMVTGLCFVAMSLVADICYFLVNPRVRTATL
jgi:ABC-type dipeptide/oligopeptide/nickel transport system permease component